MTTYTNDERMEVLERALKETGMRVNNQPRWQHEVTVAPHDWFVSFKALADFLLDREHAASKEEQDKAWRWFAKHEDARLIRIPSGLWSVHTAEGNTDTGKTRDEAVLNAWKYAGEPEVE